MLLQMAQITIFPLDFVVGFIYNSICSFVSANTLKYYNNIIMRGVCSLGKTVQT